MLKSPEYKARVNWPKRQLFRKRVRKSKDRYGAFVYQDMQERKKG